MLDNTMDNRHLEEYACEFGPGDLLFSEGDDSNELYILRSGKLAVIKGQRTIAEIDEPGEIFGEMSAVMGGKRTATVSAVTDVQAYCVPQSNLSQFFCQYPDIFKDISWLLAERLSETSKALVGFKEFCDQLPDAVVVSDRDNRIIALNSAAQRLYGRDSQALYKVKLLELFEDPSICESCLQKVQEGYSLQEQMLKLKTAGDDQRFTSVSMTGLYDDRHVYQGALTIARDVTHHHNMQIRIKRLWYWLIPSLLIMALLAGGSFLAYPYFVKGYRTAALEKSGLRNQLAKDYVVISSLIEKSMDQPQTVQKLLKQFFDLQDSAGLPYEGVVLLNAPKQVISAYSLEHGPETLKFVGKTYAHINFISDDEDSLHRVLVLYRKTADSPGGEQGVELAFQIKKNGKLNGWLVFQMDTDKLKDVYNLTVDDLKRFFFKPKSS
jgi:PAS domain S-box-containing protein